MDEAHKKAMLDESLEMKEAFELEEGMLAYVKTLSKEEHKKKLTEDAKLVYVVGRVYEEIPNNVILESLKTLFIKEE